MTKWQWEVIKALIKVVLTLVYNSNSDMSEQQESIDLLEEASGR